LIRGAFINQDYGWYIDTKVFIKSKKMKQTAIFLGYLRDGMFGRRFASGYGGSYPSSRDGVGGGCGRSSGGSSRCTTSKKSRWEGASSTLQQTRQQQ